MLWSVFVVSLASSDPLVGDQWSPFRLQDGAGQTKNWSPGRETVISFCAYWCSTWKDQVPRLKSVRDAVAGLPVDFVTISVDGRWAEIARGNQGLPLWLDPGGEWAHARGVSRVPTTVVLDSSGVVRYVAAGVVRSEELLDAVHAASSPDRSSSAVVYLSFEGFPSDGDSDLELLDMLRRLRVVAGFRCLGSILDENSKLLLRAIAEGHSVTCDSWDGDPANPQRDRCAAELKRVLGIEPSPTTGTVPNAVVDPLDETRPPLKELLRRILSAARDHSVIRLHADVSVTRQALPELIEDLRKRRFSFGGL